MSLLFNFVNTNYCRTFVKKNKYMNFKEIVLELNQELYDKFGEVEHGFSYSTTGTMDAILFSDILLWDSEADGREWIEEENDYEPFVPFIIKKFNDVADRMHSLKLPANQVSN